MTVSNCAVVAKPPHSSRRASAADCMRKSSASIRIPCGSRNRSGD